MSLKVSFQRGHGGLQGTFRPMELDDLQRRETARRIQPEIGPQGVLRNPRECRDLPVGQAVTFQPERFHPALHQRHGMVIPLLLQRGLNLGGEFESLGHGDNLLLKPQFVPAFSIPAIW